MTISQPKGYSMFCAKDKPEPDYKAHTQRLAEALRKVLFDATHGNGLQAQRDRLDQAREALAQWEKDKQ